MFSCICLDGEEEQNELRHDNPPTANPAVIETEKKEKKRLPDKMTVFTGALGSRDQCSDDDLYDLDDCSDGGYEYDKDELLFESDEGNNGIDWKWPENYLPAEVYINDDDKMAVITEVQRCIGISKKNYMTMSKATQFDLDKCTILRYLEAFQWKIEASAIADRIMETIEWRVSFGLPLRSKSLLRTELETGKVFCHGHAKDGRPVVYLQLGKENTWNAEGNTAAVVYTLERAVGAMRGQTQDAVYIIDCEGVGLTTTPSTSFISQLITVMGKHYPRRLGQIFICNTGNVFYYIWNVISLTLSEMTVKKIQILSTNFDEMKSRIEESISTEQLLVKYGGENEYTFHVDSYLRSDRLLK